MRNQRRGAALLVTLMIVAILVILAAQLSSSTRTAAVLSTNYTSDLQNYHALRAGVNYAVMMLRTDAGKGVTEDTLHETWAEPYGESNPLMVGETQVTFRIEDEERRLSARAITKQVQEGEKTVTKPNPKARERMDRLAHLLGIGVEQFGQRIVDYQDSDKEGGFEDGDDDLPLLSFGELLLVNGFTEELLYGKGGRTPHEQGLAPWLTVWGSGAVNINTAPLEVLMCLHEKITKPEAERILSYRDAKKQDGSYQSFAQIDKAVLVNDLRMAEDVADALVEVAKDGGLGVKGTCFSVFLRARSGGFESRARVVLKREGANVSVLFWDDDQRFTRMEAR